MAEADTYRNLEEFVTATRARGRHSFSWNDLRQHFDLSGKALKQALFRLKSRKKIAQVRQEFYAIITPEYAQKGMLPVHLFIDDMMKSLGKRYYVGLFSASALHGAAHQQPMEYYVITERPALRDIRNSKLRINFYVKKDWSDADIVNRKTDAGYIRVSSPELTALDLLSYGNFGISRVYTVLEELAEVFNPQKLTRTAKAYPQTAAVQRLGYLVDKELGNEKLAVALKKAVKDRALYPVPLLRSRDAGGETDPDWKIIKNTVIERDL